MVIYHVISYTIMTTQTTKQITNINEALEALCNSIIEAMYYFPVEKGTKGFLQVKIGKTMLNAHLGKKQAMTDLYIRVGE